MNDIPTEFNMYHINDVAWCPACGNHMLHKAVKLAMHELNIEPENLVTVSGIGQAAKTLQDLNADMFNALHDRSQPAAPVLKPSGRKLLVIVESGDGDLLGEEGHHFLDAIRRNADVTMIFHNNMVCDFTNVQAAPASARSTKKPVQGNSVKLESFNPLAAALTMNAPFIARAFAGDVKQTTWMIMEAIAFRGFSVIDVLQPCVVFNKLSAYQRFKKNIHYLPKSHGTSDRKAVFRLATGHDKLPLGVFFRHEGRELYEETNFDSSGKALPQAISFHKLSGKCLAGGIVSP